MKAVLSIWLALFVVNAIAQPSNTKNEDYNVGQTTLHFKDETRDRPLVTEIWYPTLDTITSEDRYFSPFMRGFTVRDGNLAAEQLPLIMLSHGSGGSRMSLEWLAQFLARTGYMVAAADHWGNTFDNKIGIEFIKPWERPLDMSFVLSELLKSERFGKAILKEKIGALGFSFGGYTVLALAGAVLDYPELLRFYRTPEGRKEVDLPEFPDLPNLIANPPAAYRKQIAEIPNLKDTRFKAFFAISPGTARGFVNKEQFKTVRDPVFLVGAASDSITPVEFYARHYHKLIPHSQYYEFPGRTGHYVMLAEAIEEVQKEAPLVFTDHPSVDRRAVHLKVQRLSLDFFEKNL